MIAVFKAGISISFRTTIYKNKDGSFSCATLGIADDFSLDFEQREDFNFYIESIKEECINDKEFDWVSEGSKYDKLL